LYFEKPPVFPDPLEKMGDIFIRGQRRGDEKTTIAKNHSIDKTAFFSIAWFHQKKSVL